MCSYSPGTATASTLCAGARAQRRTCRGAWEPRRRWPVADQRRARRNSCRWPRLGPGPWTPGCAALVARGGLAPVMLQCPGAHCTPSALARRPPPGNAAAGMQCVPTPSFRADAPAVVLLPPCRARPTHGPTPAGKRPPSGSARPRPRGDRARQPNPCRRMCPRPSGRKSSRSRRPRYGAGPRQSPCAGPLALRREGGRGRPGRSAGPSAPQLPAKCGALQNPGVGYWGGYSLPSRRDGVFRAMLNGSMHETSRVGGELRAGMGGGRRVKRGGRGGRAWLGVCGVGGGGRGAGGGGGAPYCRRQECQGNE